MLSTHLSSNSPSKLNTNNDPNSFLLNDSLQKSELNTNSNNVTNTEISSSKPLSAPINVCYIGAGYVGGTSSAVMAYKCPEDMVTVTVCDICPEKINSWNSDKVN